MSERLKHLSQVDSQREQLATSIIDEINATGTSIVLGATLAKRDALLNIPGLTLAQGLQLKEIQYQLMGQLGIVGFTGVTHAYSTPEARSLRQQAAVIAK